MAARRTRCFQPPTGDVIIRDRRTLLGLVVNPDLWLGEASMAGRMEVWAALEPVVEALSRLSAPAPSWLARVDLCNAFYLYEQWLDRELVPTCAYFATPRCLSNRLNGGRPSS
ncbi:MAG TPA: hypothetical protein VIK60_07215 [Vicinamibacterales bacterium]